MGEFKDASLWMKLALLFSVLAFGMDLYSMDTPGWVSYSSNCWSAGKSGNVKNCGGWSSTAVEAFMVIAFLCVLVAVVLVLCLVLLDELKGNKPALIAFIVFALVAGLALIIGSALIGAYWSGTNFSVMVAVFGAFCALLGGIFGILEIAGVGAGGGKK